jgi:hypothetical protein
LGSGKQNGTNTNTKEYDGVTPVLEHFSAVVDGGVKTKPGV